MEIHHNFLNGKDWLNSIFNYKHSMSARNTPPPTRSDFIMHFSCMT